MSRGTVCGFRFVPFYGSDTCPQVRCGQLYLLHEAFKSCLHNQFSVDFHNRRVDSSLAQLVEAPHLLKLDKRARIGIVLQGVDEHFGAVETAVCSNTDTDLDFVQFQNPPEDAKFISEYSG